MPGAGSGHTSVTGQGACVEEVGGGRRGDARDVTCRSAKREPAGARCNAASTLACQVPSVTQTSTRQGAVTASVMVAQPPNVHWAAR